MSSKMVRYQGGALSRISAQIQKSRIDVEVALAAYRNDRLTELADHRLMNLDWFTSSRIHGALKLERQAYDAITERPSVALMVANALVDREQGASMIVRDIF